jgi:hypothetical protein
MAGTSFDVLKALYSINRKKSVNGMRFLKIYLASFEGAFDQTL